MIRSFRHLATLLPLPLLVGCGSVLGYEDDYDLGGNAGSSGSAGAIGNGGKAGSGGGSAGSFAGGKAGSAGAGGASAGKAGTSSGGNAGTTSGGNAGNASSGNAGTSSGGNAGNASGGGGNAGADSAGSAGASVGGNGGGFSGGGGAVLGGMGGTSSAGQAGMIGGGGGGQAGFGQAGIGQAGIGQGGTGQAGTGQGGTGQAGTGQGGTSAGGGGGGGTTSPTDCSVLYVSPAGSLSNDGCSPQAPKPTPLSAIGGTKANTTEIRICAGTFPVSELTLSANVSLKGSYDCQTWQRDTLRPEAPLTKLTSTADTPTLRIVSATVKRSTVIEGIHFEGRSGGTTSRGLTVAGGASPTITSCLIEGRNAINGFGVASIGLHLDGPDSFPRVEKNLIRSGTGDSTFGVVATAGVYIEENVGAAEIVGNAIFAGDAALHGSGVGSAGIYIEPLKNTDLSGVSALRDNFVGSGHGRDASNKAEVLSAAIVLAETSVPRSIVEIIGGSLRAGEASHEGASTPGTYPTSVGIYSGNHLSLKVERVRIYGGDARGPTGTSQGINFGGTNATVIRSSLIHGGGGKGETVYPRALEGHSSGLLTVSGSTLTSGIPAPSGGGTVMYLADPGQVRLDNNLFIMQSAFAITLQLSGACAPAAGSTLRGNGFLQSNGDQNLFEGSKSGAGACSVTDDKLSTFAARFSTKSGNLRALPAASETTDVALGCATDAACLQAVLQGYDAMDKGFIATLSPGDLSFTPKLCAFAKAVGVTGLPDADLVGFPYRAVAPSYGALQRQTNDCP